MHLWRLARWPYRALDGEGGRLHSARWHTAGRPVVYAASHLSLAVLEVIVHAESSELPADLYAFALEVPDDVAVEGLDAGEMPPDWSEPGSAACRARGDAWLAAGRTALLGVPSGIVPEETNYLINPRHPDAPRVTVERHRRFTFDSRLLK